MKFTNLLPRTSETCLLIEHLEILPNRKHGITDDDLASVLPNCPNIETAILTGVPDLTDRTVIILVRAANNLKELDVSGCQQVSNVTIFELASQATALESIKLNNVPSITDPSISALTLSLAHLSVLELCNSPFLTASSARDIWTFARKLKKLRLARCSQLTDKGFPSVSSSHGEVDTGIRSAKAAKAKTNVFQEDIIPNSSSSDYFHLSEVHPRPTSWLDILPPLSLPPHHILRDLRHLDLSYCYKLTDNAIAGAVAHAPKIQYLNLTGCVEMTDKSLESISKLGQSLDVVSLGHVESVTDKGVVTFARACPRLKSIDLSFCSNLTDMSVLEIGTLTHLRRLSLVGLHALTDNALLFLAEHTPTLMRLHVSQCNQLSLEAVHTLISRLTNLEHLSASGLPSLRRLGVKRFSESAPSGYDRRLQGPYRVFIGGKILELRLFLDKELRRRREAERRNIIFTPRSDDSEDLY
ncbi:unnamed protein product [Somion occarium]|uniref:RNI-like protein n=1 Tax=Somion occarium TaxID=3059160 RepID=A0ABP1CWZ3_9APHY